MGRGYFWVGKDLHETGGGTVPFGQMYVEWEKPDGPGREYPVVLIHGGGGQGLDYLGTPDGRPGWAQLLVAAGYTVYVVDRPGHGRSPHHPDVLGPMAPTMPIEAWLDIFAPDWAASAHTQWPGGREPGDRVVQHLMASSGPMLADWAVMHALERRRMAEFLDQIGAAIIICHSAGGPAGYLAADARPDLVKALVAVETIGPPFMKRPGVSLDWGIAAAPLTFEPPAADPAHLDLVVSDADGPVPMTLQAKPARQLVNLAKVPIAVVTGEASPFAAVDGHLVEFLRQAGCSVDRIRLAEHGVRGNGHGMMWERNNDEVLRVIVDWWEAKTVAVQRS
jgi:pimeloyl-ACP methyl ester carboxylesterase